MDPETPKIKSIVVRDLTDESHGNATGVGLADVTTQKLFDKIDFGVTNRNILTSGFLERGKIPYVAQTDEEALEVALRGAGCLDRDKARVGRISDTLHLERMIVSEAVVGTGHDQAKLDAVEAVAGLWDAL